MYTIRTEEDSDIDLDTREPRNFVRFRQWVQQEHGWIHPALRFQSEANGTSVVAARTILKDTHVLSCPFSSAITPELSARALATWMGTHADKRKKITLWPKILEDWNERMLVCSYLVAHWVSRDEGTLNDSSELRHMPYLDTLPPYELLTTSLTFSLEEMELIRGTNLHGATLSRLEKLTSEHHVCLGVFKDCDQRFQDAFTFRRYLTAAVYLSSRAFPSSVLSTLPTLVSSPESPAHPVLLPIIDCLNHSRGKRVTWLVEEGDPGITVKLDVDKQFLRISILFGEDVLPSSEVFNNYGAKPNSELILGYGFTLPDNPDDTIVLQLGGSAAKREIGRKEAPQTGEKIEELLEEATLQLLKVEGIEVDGDFQEFDPDKLNGRREAAILLLEAIDAKIKAQPRITRRLEKPIFTESPVRDIVIDMIFDYVQGQLAILHEMKEAIRAKKKAAEVTMREMDYKDPDSDDEPPDEESPDEYEP